MLLLWLGSGCVRVTRAQTAPVSPAEIRAPASITGQVRNETGATLAGAQVVATPLEPATDRPANVGVSGADGDFTLGGLPPGAYTLSVRLQGFTPANQRVDLQAGREVALAPITLLLGTVAINVDAITPEEATIEQLHTEEHQRLVGLLPNFFVSYNWTAGPLTSMQKYKLATHTVFDPGNLVLSGLVSGVQQADNAFPGYGQGVAGYSKRFGANLGNLVIGTYLGGAVLPSLFHQDPRYFYKGTGTKRARFLYAVSRAVITRGDNGHAQPNFSGILGDLSSGALSNLYYPASDRQGATLFLENSVLAIGGDALTGFVQEFVFGHFTLNNFSKRNKSQP